MSESTSAHKAKPDVVCIIGMHRSGTSMVARLLSLCGLYLGAGDQMYGPNEGNPDGHFEHTGFLQIDEELLRHFGGAWESPPQLNIGWQNDPALSRLVSAARALIRSFPDGSTWGWKEPRTTILLEFWKMLVPNLRFVICVRNPLDVANSLARRNGMTIEAGIQLWYRYMRDALSGTAGYPVVFTFYDDYFASVGTEILRLARFCRLPEPVDLRRYDDIVSRDLRHHVSGDKEFMGDSSAGTETKMFYLMLRSLLRHDLTDQNRDLHIGDSVRDFMHLTDELCEEERVMQLESLINAKTLQLSDMGLQLHMANQKLALIEKEFSELQRRADRLETFAEAVRQTLAYRVYSNWIKPLTQK